MVRITRSWTRQHRKSARRLRKAVKPDRRLRRPLFEELEDRRMLSVNFSNLANSLDSQLASMQSRVTSGLNAYKTGQQSTIPLVGSSLGTASQVVSRFNMDVKNALASLGTISNPTESQIQNALMSVPQLVDRGGNGVGREDVIVTFPSNFGSEGFAVEMRLGGSYAPSSTN